LNPPRKRKKNRKRFFTQHTAQQGPTLETTPSQKAISYTAPE
jgi:hypothetical protein